ncbi:ShlB/FhaC/HecB family hemolysin secretion/activation protein [uncultured Gelidibacter sp.]|uniref:ShlB/FhaC/HecB family hemolysin secretion/activation protein n=1 Tax=uncultured Gelidibacter sp. TaxID=259318 RepID=UPI00261714B9|nr:ShlB/FhaC/HecB family hemolysin secretion/activation protein [uncultured Gelidibacter sp.]
MTLKIFSFFFLFGWFSSPTLLAQTLHLTANGKTEEETNFLEGLNYQNAFSDFNTLNEEVQKIKSNLTQYGYLESQFINLEKTTDSSFVATYHLGVLYKKARIYFDIGLNEKILKSISNTITENYFEVELHKLETSLQNLNTEIANNGDPFSTLQLINIKKENGILVADLKIEDTHKRTIDTIIVKGYDKFPKAYVKRYLKLQAKQPFNLKTIKRKTLDLENLHFATQIKEPEVLFTKDSTILYIYVEKQKSNTFDGFLGFGTNTKSNKIEFDGYLNLNLINTLNYGESFRVLYKSDENDQKTFDVKAKLPYLFGSPIGTQIGLNIFKRDSTFITTSQFAKADYQINPNNTIAIGITSLNSTNLLDTHFLNIADFKSTFYTINYNHLTPQRYDKLFPINFMFDFSTGFGNRTIKSISDTQTKFELNTFKIFNLNFRNSIYTNVSAVVLNSDRFLENELFRFGGINSIRGFEENSLMANLFGVLNTEYRYKLTNSLYVNSIIDLAYYENQIISTQNKLLGLGFGFGILTRAGLFKLNYSNGSSENHPIKLSNSKIHISLSATF